MNITVKDIAWAAGFLEGEGSFSIHGLHRKSIAGIATEATQKQKEPLDKLQKLFGGTIFKIQHGKFWRWNKGGAELMMTIYPIMSQERQEKIKKCLLAWHTTDNRKQSAIKREANKRRKRNVGRITSQN